MSEKVVVHTGSAPSAIGPYSQAIRTGEWVYCSGQVALDPKSGAMVGDDVASQTEQALRNLAAVLEEAGASLADVVKTTVYLKSMDDFTAMNAVYANWFADTHPARATVEVARLPKDGLVEIDCVARAS